MSRGQGWFILGGSLISEVVKLQPHRSKRWPPAVRAFCYRWEWKDNHNTLVHFVAIVMFLFIYLFIYTFVKRFCARCRLSLLPDTASEWDPVLIRNLITNGFCLNTRVWLHLRSFYPAARRASGRHDSVLTSKNQTINKGTPLTWPINTAAQGSASMPLASTSQRRRRGRFAKLQRETLLFALNICVVFKAISTIAVQVAPPKRLACVHFHLLGSNPG